MTRLYQETAERIDLETKDHLCKYLSCEIGDLFTYIKEKLYIFDIVI